LIVSYKIFVYLIFEYAYASRNRGTVQLFSSNFQLKWSWII